MSVKKPNPNTLTAKFTTVEYENNDKRLESLYSIRIRAGKRRTYFLDVRATRANDYYLTITESRKRFNDNGYDRHKVFLYKEDFNKFIKALNEAVDYVKTELMPDFDFDAFNHDENQEGDENHTPQHMVINSVETDENGTIEKVVESGGVEEEVERNDDGNTPEEVDKW